MDNSTFILNQIKSIVKKNAPSAKVYLYGSRVRGTSHEDSDWDILILLTREKITNDVEEKITDPLYDLEFEVGEVISPMIYTEKEWSAKYSVTPFYHNVMKERRLL
ncbi:MAG: nucleotidyltransferase domain-containing protein [Bacteroidota bacterium]|nr:nucleotidyltransferase domain-containing protein [Bacteroidota bacterium]